MPPPSRTVRRRRQGTRGPPPLPPPRPPTQAQERTEADRRNGGPTPPPRKGGAAAVVRGHHGRGRRPHALPAASGQRTGDAQDGANGEGKTGKTGARTRAEGFPPPPPRRTDPLAADRTAPDARGRPASPRARVYPGGACRGQRKAGRRPTGRGGGGATPPLHPPQLGSHRSGPPPPRSRGDAPPPPQKGPRRGGGGCGWTCSRGGHGRGASPRQRAGATRATEQYGGRAPHDPPVTTAHSGRAEGGSRLQGPPGKRSTGRPSPPPTPGRHCDPDRTRTPEGSAPMTRGGPGLSTAGRHPEGEQGGRGATPPPPPHWPASRRGPAPPPRQGGWSPPPPERGARARPAPPPQPPAPTGAAENKRARANAPGRRTDRAQRRRASTNRSGMGGHAPHGQHDASDTRFIACPGKAEGRNKAEQPPALQAPPRPPPRTRTPRTRPAARSPHRACRPRGQRRAPTPARPRPQHVGSGRQQPAQWAGSRGRGSA